MKEKRKITIIRGICIGLILGVFWPTSLYVITYWQVKETVGYVMLVLRAIAILGTALYCFPLCLSTMIFFIKMKIGEAEINFKVFCLMLWIFFLWSTKLIHAVGLGIVVSL